MRCELGLCQVRYEGEEDEPDLEMVDYIPSSPNGEPYHGLKSTLLEWHLQDPVDDWEIQRNDKVYFYQENRNPFIDYPEFVNLIWNLVSADKNQMSLSSFNLYNYPNPFKPSGAGHSPATTISFSLNNENTEDTEIIIFNLKGQKVKRLSTINGQQSVVWNGKDSNGNPVCSGVYFYYLKVNEKTISIKKCLLLK